MKQQRSYLDHIYQTHELVNAETIELYEDTTGNWKNALDATDDEIRRLLKEAKRFEINVEKSQVTYDDLMGQKTDKRLMLSSYKNFRLPFDVTMIGFVKPLVVKWTQAKNRTEYADTKLGGVLFEASTGQPIGLSENYGGGITAYARLYRAYLFFDEAITGDVKEQLKTNGQKLTGDAKVISSQFVSFLFGEATDGDFGRVMHVDHYPCQNKSYCSIGDKGQIKEWANGLDQQPVCQEILARDSLVEVLVEIVTKINTSQPIEVKRKVSSNGHATKPLPFGFPYTKGNLPKDHYTQYIDGVHRVYEKDDIAYGMGVKHKYRYDVRRHPRIVGDKIVWIEPHTRGAGKYIPKTYKNRRTWFVQYLFYLAEKLTKHRKAEILFVKLIKLLRRLK